MNKGKWLGKYSLHGASGKQGSVNAKHRNGPRLGSPSSMGRSSSNSSAGQLRSRRVQRTPHNRRVLRTLTTVVGGFFK